MHVLLSVPSLPDRQLNRRENAWYYGIAAGHGIDTAIQWNSENGKNSIGQRFRCRCRRVFTRSTHFLLFECSYFIFFNTRFNSSIVGKNKRERHTHKIPESSNRVLFFLFDFSIHLEQGKWEKKKREEKNK